MRDKLTNLIVGDWSRDGHERSDTYLISSNLDGPGIKEAFKKGSKIVGFNLTDDVAADYRSVSLPTELCEKLWDNGHRFGLQDGEILADSLDENGLYLWPEAFVEVYLFIVKLGDPSFEHEFVRGSHTINVGGYGLYD